MIGLVATAGMITPAPAAQEKDEEPIRIGMSQSIFVDVPLILVKLFAPSFNDLTYECTGLEAKMMVGGDPFELTRKVRGGEMEFGVYQGVEFAWVSQKHDDLVPLMIALNRHKYLKSHLVVRKDSEASGFGDLRGKDLALPKRSKEHCRLFLERSCADSGQCEPKTFFSELKRPNSTETALDEVCAGRVAATVVESVALESYENIKPGCFARLKVIKTSETFPVGVIAYKKGTVSDPVLKKFKDGMISANKNERTREMMNVYQITAFEPVPADYHQLLADIVRAYPAPEAGAKVSQK
jgi:ABC-type phosphate/phosphonate transport system substrate-binding protein